MPPRSGLDAYREVWLVDFEFSAPPGERPDSRLSGGPGIPIRPDPPVVAR